MLNLKNYQPSLKNKNYTELRYGFKTEAEKISDQHREFLNLKPHDPCPAILLTNFLRVHVKEIHTVDGISGDTIDNLLDGDGSTVSAITLYCASNKRFMIVHNHTHSSPRKESNLMHECAHIILNHQMEEFDSSNGFELRNYNETQEAEAKYLGHCLQLPKAALTKYFVFEKREKEDIANLFNASFDVVNYRLRMCGSERHKNNYGKKYL